MKLASIFFKASADYIRFYPNRGTNERESSISEWVKIHFHTQRAQQNFASANMKLASIFFKASADYIRFYPNIETNERTI